MRDLLLLLLRPGCEEALSQRRSRQRYPEEEHKRSEDPHRRHPLKRHHPHRPSALWAAGAFSESGSGTGCSGTRERDILLLRTGDDAPRDNNVVVGVVGVPCLVATTPSSFKSSSEGDGRHVEIDER